MRNRGVSRNRTRSGSTGPAIGSGAGGGSNVAPAPGRPAPAAVPRGAGSAPGIPDALLAVLTPEQARRLAERMEAAEERRERRSGTSAVDRLGPFLERAVRRARLSGEYAVKLTVRDEELVEFEIRRKKPRVP